MSSDYYRICLSHNPYLVIDVESVGDTVPPATPKDHVNCKIGLGRYSYPLIDIWLPTPYMDASGQHCGQWYDVSWLRDFPGVPYLRGGSSW